MPDQRDTMLVEQAKIQRMRLAAALLYGRIDERRTVNDHVRRLIGSLVLAAVACAVCVGVSFVGSILAERAAVDPAASVAVIPTPEAP